MRNSRFINDKKRLPFQSCSLNLKHGRNTTVLWDLIEIWGLVHATAMVPACAGAPELQADEELDSKLVIMHSGGEPAVSMCFIPPTPPVCCSGPALHHAGCEGTATTWMS